REWGEGDHAQRRMRPQAPRRGVDIIGSIMQHQLGRIHRAGPGGNPYEVRSMQPHSSYVRRMLPPLALKSNPSSGVCTQWVKTSINKQRCPVFCLAWAPEGVTRCITGNSGGEFTLWNDGAFNFATILQVE
ncbi:unnamed protein product, partial [Choristocarpus tenellus]